MAAASGKAKKEAEQEAARLALTNLPGPDVTLKSEGSG